MIANATVGVLLSACSVVFVTGQDPNNLYDPNSLPKVSIALTKYDVNDTSLELRYQIKNHSDGPVWICDDINRLGRISFEVFFTQEANFGCSIMNIRRRLSVPSNSSFDEIPFGHYVCLDANTSRNETLVIPLPVHWRWKYTDLFFAPEVDTWDLNARKLLIEIGAYDEDLPATIITQLTEAEENPSDPYLSSLSRMFGGVSGFINHYKLNERSILIPWNPFVNVRGEDILSIEVKGIYVPWVKEQYVRPEELLGSGHWVEKGSVPVSRY